MKISKLVGLPAIAVAGLMATAAGAADENQFRANLAGFREVPAISTVARGEFRAVIINDNTIAYELTYSGLEGNVTQAHIHFGQRFATGGISLWLCQVPGKTTDPAGLAPICPQEAQGERTVAGNLTVANLVGPEDQGIDGTPETRPPEEFAEIVKAIRAGVTYANVHSTKFPGGEIRGQIRMIEDKDPKVSRGEPGITPAARLSNNRIGCEDTTTSVAAIPRLRRTADSVQTAPLAC